MPAPMLDIQSEDKGLLMPRMTTLQRNAILSPAPGLMIYNMDDSCFNYFSGQEWVLDCGRLLSQSGSSNLLLSNGETEIQSGRDIALDQNGNLFVAGIFKDSIRIGNDLLVNNGNDDFFIAKYDPSGNPLWAVHGYSDDPGREVSVNRMSIDQNGKIYVSGFGRSNLSIEKEGSILATIIPANTNSGSPHHAFWAKFSTNGILEDYDSHVSEYNSNFFSEGRDISVNQNGYFAMTGNDMVSSLNQTLFC